MRISNCLFFFAFSKYKRCTIKLPPSFPTGHSNRHTKLFVTMVTFSSSNARLQSNRLNSLQSIRLKTGIAAWKRYHGYKQLRVSVWVTCWKRGRELNCTSFVFRKRNMFTNLSSTRKTVNNFLFSIFSSWNENRQQEATCSAQTCITYTTVPPPLPHPTRPQGSHQRSFFLFIFFYCLCYLHDPH